MRLAPFTSSYAPKAMVSTVDHLASEAGLYAIRSGGTAADAAVAASAVLAVTTQHMCGLGGDLFALVLAPGAQRPAVLEAAGRSGSGADAERLRSKGLTEMPPSGDIASVPVPGCVDGWLALHRRYGSLPLEEVLAPAREYAATGFPASPLLVAVAASVAGLPGGADFAAATRPGAIVRRPGVARVLDAVAADGREGFYLGEFGKGLLALGCGEYSEADLAEDAASWAEPLGLEAWGYRIFTVGPPSQGYLTLASCWIAERAGLPGDPEDPLWAHLGIEAARQAAFDRLEVLHEHADGSALLAEERLAPRSASIDPERAAPLGACSRQGGTVYLCAVDEKGMAVSLIQSNAAGFGSGIAEPSTGIFLHNRGIGFSLRPGHPAEYGPRRRPPSTLSPALVTRRDGGLHAVIGTMGGDSQPQVLLQLLARILHSGEPVGDAVAAPRWVLESPAGKGGFSTWEEAGTVRVRLEAGVPETWPAELRAKGHDILVAPGNFGHAQAVLRGPGCLEGAADPRSLTGSAAGC